LGEVLKNIWKNKVMHGQYIRNTDRQLIREEYTFLWLSKGDLKAETESEIVAAQDQTIQIKYYATKILNTETDSKCRLCQQFDETISHIILACPLLAKEQYIKDTIECVHNYTSTYVRKQGYNWTKTLVRTCPKISRNRSYCGISKFKLTEPFLTTNQTL
jgi:hypothetical protein